MDVDNLYEELSLWEQLQFSEKDEEEEKRDDGWTSFASANEEEGGLLVGNKTFWEIEDFGGKILDENVSLGRIFDSSSNDGDHFADWLDERIDVADIDEMVNSPEFHSVMLDMSHDASSMLDDIEPIPLNCSSKSDDVSTSKEISWTSESLLKGETSDETCASFSGAETIVVSDVACDGSVVVEVQLVYSEEEESVVVPQSPASSLAHNFVVEESNSVSSVYSTPCNTPPSSPEYCPRPPSPSIRKNNRSKPYSRPSKKSNACNETSEDDESRDSLPTDRKARKRDQNKTAATRYRNKKRSEFDVLSTEEVKLVETNKELSCKATQLETEISYLKSLMKEILIAKGLLKK